MATDWTKLQTEYVHGTMTMRELAEQHGIKSAGVMRRAANEKWEAQRKQQSAAVSKLVTANLTESRADDLSRFNADDLNVARALRSQVAAHIRHAQAGNGKIPPAELRALAASAEASQRIGRLALGVPTDNKSITGPGGGPIQSVSLTPGEFARIAAEVAGKV